MSLFGRPGGEVPGLPISLALLDSAVRREHMPRLPKNIATMTDAERYKWWSSLSDAECDRLADRTFRLVDYAVNQIDEHGDIVDVEIWDTIAEARRSFKAAELEGEIDRIEIEKRTSRHHVADARLVDRDEVVIAEKGRRATS
jgi:hypothetical protein